MTEASFTAAVIAGGQSSRMRRDKAFLPWRGGRLLDHQLSTLRALRPDEVLISGRPGIDYGCCAARVVTDDVAGAGPLAGLAAILDAIKTPRVVVLAIDLPEIPTAFLARMLGHTDAGIVPRLEGKWEPLAAVYPRSLRFEAKARVTGTDRSLRGLIEAGMQSGGMIPYEVAPAERPLFRNLNTPDDYRAAT